MAKIKTYIISEAFEQLNNKERKLKEERNPYGKIFFVVYELDKNGDEVEDIKAFSNKDVAIKFAQKQSFPTHVVLVPDFDPDDYGKEAERWIIDTYGYGPFEVVWDNEEIVDEALSSTKRQPFTVMFFHETNDNNDFSTHTGIMYGQNEAEIKEKFAEYCPSCTIDRIKKGILGFDYPLITSSFEDDMGWKDSDDIIFEELDISTYIPLSTTETRGGKTYQFFRKLENGKGKWAAVEICDGKQCGEPFAITYEQARGFEPINPTEKTSKILGKKLLP